MRACMVAYTFYEGDNRVRRYAESLARRGDTVDAVVLRQKGSARTTTIKNVTVHKIQRRTPNERGLRDYLIRLLLFLFRSGILLSLRQLRRPYQLIHVHSVPDFEVFAAFLPKLTGAKVILDIHDIVPELYISKFGASRQSLLYRLLVGVERISGAFADHVIIANHIWHERITMRSVSPEKCSVILNYPDPHIFSYRKIERRDGPFLLLYPGSLTRHQGLETAIRAVKMLHERIKEIEFHIYGGGTDEEFFRGLVRELGLRHIVLFKGLVSIDAVSAIMTQGDLGVEPKSNESFSDEAFSTKILEFMAVGVPVVVSDTTVHRRYLNDSIVSFFKSGDPESLMTAMWDLYRNPGKRRRLVKRGLSFMKSHNWNAKEHIYLNLASSLCEAARLRDSGHERYRQSG